jgi:porin
MERSRRPHVHAARGLSLLAGWTFIACLIAPSLSHSEPAATDASPAVEISQSDEKQGELPASIRRLFGETVPFPDPEESGFEFYALAMQDAFANTTGGASRGGGIIGNLDLALTIDTEKAGWWDGGKFHIEGIGVYGRRPSQVVGDYQYSSSIDAPDTIEPFQLYYEQTFFGGSLSLLAGVHDYSLEYGVAEYGWDFIHSSFWTPSTMTQIWWSFYPCTGLGTRAKLQMSDSWYLLAGVYDGNPTDQANTRKIDWGLSKRDGAHTLVELGFDQGEEGKRPYKVALGGWYNSGEFDSADGGLMHANSGTYLVGQALLVSEDETYERGLGGFFQVGQADNTRNFNSWYFGAGLRYKGVFTSRPDDILGLAWGRAEIGSTFRNANPGTDSFEGNAELTYRIAVQPWITVQPAVTLITNPGANSLYDDAVILYLRSEVLL